jgi:hypothetical protein
MIPASDMRSHSGFALTLAMICLVNCSASTLAGAEAATKAKKKGASDTVWTIGLYAGSNPFDLKPVPGVANPVFTAADTGDPGMDIVAHPFLAIDGGRPALSSSNRMHLFFTLKSTSAGTGVIGVAESVDDGRTWSYRGVALREASVLSYPCVFKSHATYFMVVESSDNVIRLYRASEFPLKWQVEAEVVRGEKLVSPTILQHGGRWWLFVGAGNATLRLFHSATLKGPWTEHPRSPIVANDANIARPAGRPFVHDGKLYRLAQDCEPTYGSAVVAFEITTLTETDYRERAVEKTLVSASGSGWNSAAMHHIDAHRAADGSWIAVVDARGSAVVRRP